MRPERLEDLGRIRELMDRLLSDYEDLKTDCANKHTMDVFVEVYGEADRRCELHCKLRFLFEALEDIKYIAMGDVYE